MLELQEAIKEYLLYKGYSPFLVIYTEAKGTSLLKITFGSMWEYQDFLKDMKLDKRCDKTGINEFSETVTIILTGIALKDFIDYVKSSL